jgi:cysteine synthase A
MRAASVRPIRGDGILDAIGQTPLVGLSRLFEHDRFAVYAKLEGMNPGGSAKDRPAHAMLAAAMAVGRVTHETLIVESSSGNMAIGLAQYCAYHSLELCCVVDERIQPQNLAILKAFGVRIEFVEEPVGGDFLAARLRRVQEIVDSEKDAFWPNQYANTANPRAHEDGTMREIVEALGQVDFLFAAASSTGTIGGCSSYVARHGMSTKLIAVDAFGSALFGGSDGSRIIPGLGSGVIPPLADQVRVDAVVRVGDLDCVVGCRRLVRREAILAGGSSGGVVEAVRRFGPNIPDGAVVVVVLADSGVRYVDTVFDDVWVEHTLGVGPIELARLCSEPDPTHGQPLAGVV